MGLFAPCRSQRHVLHDARCSGRLLGVLVIIGLSGVLHAPLHAAEPPERGGTIVWAVHESMPSFDLHYDNSYIVAQPIGPLYNGLLTFDGKCSGIPFFQTGPYPTVCSLSEEYDWARCGGHA